MCLFLEAISSSKCPATKPFWATFHITRKKLIFFPAYELAKSKRNREPLCSSCQKDRRAIVKCLFLEANLSSSKWPATKCIKTFFATFPHYFVPAFALLEVLVCIFWKKLSGLLIVMDACCSILAGVRPIISASLSEHS